MVADMGPFTADAELSPSCLCTFADIITTGDEPVHDALHKMGEEVDRRRREDSKASLKEWGTWAVESVKGGGKAAHKFAMQKASDVTSLLDAEGVPQVGAGALSALLDQWVPLWCAADRQDEHPSQWSVPVDEAQLEPVALDRLLEVCRKYAPGAGLGWD
eukprot:4282430-Pyramimonas_sp.AAC.1